MRGLQPGETDPLFARVRVTAADERVFLYKLAALTLLSVVGIALVLQSNPLANVVGTVLLALMFTHAVELQHQCLHHSAFRRAAAHRLIGVPLGLPLLVVYSHYRVRHLQHHRYLGTSRDTEFFGFDTRATLTVGHLLRGMFDYCRLVTALRDVVRAATGGWRYEHGVVSAQMRRRILHEHFVLGGLVMVAFAAIVTGYGQYPLRLWLLPLLLAVPMHFLVELPEHLLCEAGVTDVLRNTRSITGSRLSTWFTNGNNLHIEHHAAMSVPINRLPERHQEVHGRAVNVQRSYFDFYRLVWQTLRDGTHGRTSRPAAMPSTDHLRG